MKAEQIENERELFKKWLLDDSVDHIAPITAWLARATLADEREKALLKYVQHKVTCKDEYMRMTTGEAHHPCTCGLDALTAQGGGE